MISSPNSCEIFVYQSHGSSLSILFSLAKKLVKHSNNNKITWTTSDAAKYAPKTLLNGKKGFDLTTKIPTYAVKESALPVGGAEPTTEIKDIYKWDGSETHLAKQMVLQTTREDILSEDKKAVIGYGVKEGVQNLISTTSTVDKIENGAIPFTISPNCVVRLRIYVWLEGQDVDCINYASHGGGVVVNLGLVKGSSEGSKGEEPEE